MKLTAEQQSAVAHPGNILVTACPGSGKTSALIAKLIDCAADLRGTPFRVACITYTNTAVYEIEGRLDLRAPTYSPFCDVSTIHTFCINSILKPNYWRSRGYKNGFSIAPPDSNVFKAHCATVIEDHGLDRRASREFEMASRSESGEVLLGERSRLTQESVVELWDLLARDGYMDFPTVLYESWLLVRDHPSISRYLASRYSWILMDETQDTSSLQISIMETMAASGSKFFMVGDPHQSIFAFAHADFRRVQQFAIRYGCRTDLSFTNNFRSSERIVRTAESLIARSPSMVAAGDDQRFPIEPLIIHAPTSLDGILNHFLPVVDDSSIRLGACAILAPQWSKLYRLAVQLRDAGIPVRGPGARPYKYSRIVVPFLEYLAACGIYGQAAFFPRLMREAKALLEILTGVKHRIPDEFALKTCLHSILMKCHPSVLEKTRAIDWLPAASDLSITELTRFGFMDGEFASNWKQSLIEIFADMSEKRDFDKARFSTIEIAGFVGDHDSLRLLTIHQSKGREFDAVAVVDLHQGTLPFGWPPNPATLEEERRKLYVAISRPRKVLALISDKDRPDNEPSQFLSEITTRSMAKVTRSGNGRART